MPGKKIKMVDGVGCVSITRALDEFTKRCKRRNLSPVTVKYYAEDIIYFQKVMQLENTGEICKEILDSFVDHEMNKGNKITAINSRLRGLRVFFRYCAETGRSYPFKYPLLKEDEYLKEPYTRLTINFKWHKNSRIQRISSPNPGCFLFPQAVLQSRCDFHQLFS